MQKILYSFFLLIISLGAVAQSNELQRYYAQAMQAFQEGNHAKFYESIMKAYELNPHHQGILYQAGIAAALNNKKTEAIQYLKEAVLMQSDFTLNIPELKSLNGMPEFEKLKKLQQEISKPVIKSDTAFILKDRSLHAESVIAGEEEGVFYLGSIHKRKIVKVINGVSSDFTKEAQDGLGSVFSVKVDMKKKALWACSSPMPEMKDFNATLPSAVFRYDLKTGKLVKKYLPENPSMNLILGDLAINKKGEVFVSDSRNNLIFKVNEFNGKLEQIYSSEDFINIQGITFSDDGKFMFIADYVKGIFRLEMDGLKLILLPAGFDTSLKSVDGLSYYHNTLIAIQNGIKPMRVTRYILNDRQDKLTAFEILDQAHPAFNEPTLGCINGTTFYYVANSQWSGYDNEHHIKPDAQLQDPVVLKINLN